MAQAQKPSTMSVYEGKWQVFASWCRERDTNPLQANLPMIADFLCELHEDKKLAYSTIDGYRTALGHMMKAFQGIDLARDPHISSLFANFARDSSRQVSRLPKWDLAFVLQVLTMAPFEPLDKAPLNLLTLKTVFLVTLASGRRRSEIHALTRESLMRAEDWTSVTVSPCMEFVAKTELANKGVKVLNSLTLQSLSAIVGSEMPEDLTLCPVRALRIYIQRTDLTRTETQKKLFMSYKKNFKKDISKNTISGWLRKMVLHAYDQGTPEVKRLFKVKAHDVRSMAASWAFFHNASVDNIMAACSWKCHNTFTSFYLRDLTRIQGDMLALGPIIAALHTS